MFKPTLAMLVMSVSLPAIARADCNAPATDSERAQCIGHDLRQSDVAINDTYAQLRARLSPEGQNDLRHQEIDWIKARAHTCLVDTKEPDRDKWIANLLKDYSKTVCVVRFTERRIAELRQQQAALAGPARAAPAPLPPLAANPAPPALPGPASSASPPQETVAPAGAIFELDAQRTVSQGKWYFEVALARGEIAKTASASIFIGVRGVGSSTGTLQTIHPRNIGQLKLNVGIAVDLDNGKLYIRNNGAWTAEPGSSGGLDLKLGHPYLSVLASSVPLDTYLGDGLVDVNFGQLGFVYAMPDGYQPLDTSPPRRVVEQ